MNPAPKRAIHLAAMLAVSGVVAFAQPDSWTTLRSGWLYVLDHFPAHSRLLLVDPATGGVAGSIRTGYSAEMALSRNGAKLFLSFGDYENEPRTLKLAVVDTASGKVETVVDNEGALLWHMPPPVPNLSASPDGSRVFVLKRRKRAPGANDYAVAPFDVRTERFLQEIPVPSCSSANLFAYNETRFILACGGQSQVIFGNADSPESVEVVDLPFPQGWSRHDGSGFLGEQLRQVSLTPDGSSLLAVRNDGKLANVSIATRKLLNVERAAPESRWIGGISGAVSPDGRLLYVPNAPKSLGLQGKMTEVAIVDAQSREPVGTIRTSQTFWSLSVSPDGRYLYALCPGAASILIIDARTRTEIRTLRVGTKPSQIIVAP